MSYRTRDKDEMTSAFYNEERAASVVAAFSVASGLGVTLFSPSERFGVEVRFSRRSCQELCPRAKDLQPGEGWPEECKRVHRLASIFADNANSSYLYICPEDNMFFCAPVVVDSRLVAASTIGPVRIETSADTDEAPDVFRSIDEDDGVPLRTGEYLQQLALIFSTAMFGFSVSEGAVSLSAPQAQRPYGADAPLLGLKSVHVKEYPVEFERKLIDAVRQANKAEASHALNELLGFLLSSSLVDSRYRFRERIDELVSVVSHSALRAGVSAEVLFPAIERCRGEMRFMNSEDQMCSRAHHFTEQVISLVQNLYDVEFDDFKYRAVSFIHENYRRHVSLDEAADSLGFSPSYFSRTFKEHMGCTFVTYVNEVRIQAAKSELISTDKDIAEIADSVGFDSVSYFIRVFKRETSMTPGNYRSRRGQMLGCAFTDINDASDIADMVSLNERAQR
ncbi:MAG: helix-turn-helix domain-containing protein [Eggerthellales bacterium]|nr:helix-turn-helix domain-containing protein [Eggerthellales bacterium]